MWLKEGASEEALSPERGSRGDAQWQPKHKLIQELLEIVADKSACIKRAINSTTKHTYTHSTVSTGSKLAPSSLLWACVSCVVK